MAAGDTQITLVGNLVDDPQLRYTPTGQAVANFRLASTPRYLDKNTNERKDADSLFLSCNVWRQAPQPRTPIPDPKHHTSTPPPPPRPHHPRRGRASAKEHHDGQATDSQAKKEGLPVLPGEDHPRGLQGHGAAAEVHLRPRQDPGPAGLRQLHAASARRRHRDQERPRDGTAAVHEHGPITAEGGSAPMSGTPMKLILTQEVTGLGAPGDVVEVAGGYRRNYLVPRGLAMHRTRGAQKRIALRKRARSVR